MVCCSSGDKLAVVGPNGAGKSSLLKIIAGTMDHDNGSLYKNKGATIGYLPQADLNVFKEQGGLAKDMTVLQAVLASDSEMAKAVQEYQRALANANGRITPDLESAIERMNTYNAWQVDAEAKRLLDAVGLTNPNATVNALSGGQRRRLALAAALLGNPELLILDEPTNHMDVQIIDWMARELTGNADLAVVMVTHDRSFMEATCTRLLELDGFGGAYLHKFGGAGSYKAFKEAREARRHAQASAAADARAVAKKEAEWMSRQPKAREKKSKARQDAFVELTQRARNMPAPDVEVDFGALQMVRQGNKAVVMKGVSVLTPAGKELIRDFTFSFLPGERLGVAGPNGVGKSSLLDVIAGVRAPSGGIREEGETAVIGYFQQHPPEVDDNLRLIDYIRSVADDRKARSAGAAAAVEPPEILLEKLGFPRKRHYQKVESLSGGERRRLHLAAVLAEAPNILLLDEPTNDLDLATVEKLEEMLKVYRGVLLVVSHDRAFMDNSTDRLLVLKGDGLVRLFGGTYTEYLEMLEQEKFEAEAAQQEAARNRTQQERAYSNGSASTSGSSSSSSSSSSPPAAAASNGKGSSSTVTLKPSKRKLGWKEMEEYKKLGEKIDAMSARRDKMNDQLVTLAQSSVDLAKIEAASVELGKLTDEIEAKSERWLELAEIAGDI
eukprot:jgi/Chrzof1/10664/Cz05g07140.t1